MKFIILFALVAAVACEPPSNNYGQYSAPSYSSYSAPSSGYQSYEDDGSSYVDDALFARIAQLLEQNEQSSHSSGGYQAYGPPARQSQGVILGKPERAQRVAEFDLTESRSTGGYSQGGYSNGGYSNGWN